MHQDAVETLRDVFESVGLAESEAAPGDDQDFDILLQGPRDLLAIEVKTLSLADRGRVQSMIDRVDARSAKSRSTLQRAVILVADELPDSSRDLLRRHGWGYLD